MKTVDVMEKVFQVSRFKNGIKFFNSKKNMCRHMNKLRYVHPPKVWEWFVDDAYSILKHTDQYLHYNSHHQTSCKETIGSSLFNRAYSVITNKDDLTKGNAKIKHVLKEKDIKKSLLVKSLKSLLYKLKYQISRITIVKRSKLQNTVRKQITIGKAG